MDTNKESGPAPRAAWWEVRHPPLFYLLGVTFIAGSILRIGAEPTPLNIVVIVAGFVLAALNFVAATMTIIARRRRDEPGEHGPQAQESDPRFRHTP